MSKIYRTFTLTVESGANDLSVKSVVKPNTTTTTTTTTAAAAAAAAAAATATAAQATRRLTTDCTARVRIQVSEEWRFILAPSFPHWS